MTNGCGDPAAVYHIRSVLLQLKQDDILIFVSIRFRSIDTELAAVLEETDGTAAAVVRNEVMAHDGSFIRRHGDCPPAVGHA